MSPDSSYARYDAPPAPDSIMSSAHKEREPELHIGRLPRLIVFLSILASKYQVLPQIYNNLG